LKKTEAPKKDFEVKVFKDSEQFRKWLLKYHSKKGGVWLRLFKKASKKKCIDRGDALEEALCFGWIDGQAKTLDEESWLQKFTPRRARSVWSKRNTEIVTKLINSKRMHASGLVEIDKAKADGRWEKAYDSPKNMKVPNDFIIKIKKNKKAYEFFKSLNKANLYAIGWRLQTAKKEETRLKRMAAIIKMLAAGEKFH
jgi:uncharacterized protein YdeI (YjbR/CyaY-like superfamily)